MSTQNLNDVVSGIVNEWITQEKLFTALDVSLEVKKTLPHARHREVRDVVRSEYTTMQNANYGKTDIDVTLDDGSTTKAVLYHPLADSWDLDTKYDAQKRAQTIKKPVAPATTTVDFGRVTVPVAAPVPAQQMSIGDLIKQKLAQQTSASAPTMVATTSTQVSTPQAVNPNKHLWDALFDSAPSLFPRR